MSRPFTDWTVLLRSSWSRTIFTAWTRIWKDRYPSLRVLAPAAAREKVEEIVPVDATSFDFGDPRVSFVTVPGTGEREAASSFARRPGPPSW